MLIVIRLVSNLSTFKRHLCLTNIKNGYKFQNGHSPLFSDPTVKENRHFTGILLANNDVCVYYGTVMRCVLGHKVP